MSGGDPWKDMLAGLDADTAALAKALASLPAPSACEVEYDVWAPCSAHRTIIAANAESAARRYVRRNHSPSNAPREVFVRGPGGLRLVSLEYTRTTKISAEVSHG